MEVRLGVFTSIDHLSSISRCERGKPRATISWAYDSTASWSTSILYRAHVDHIGARSTSSEGGCGEVARGRRESRSRCAALRSSDERTSTMTGRSLVGQIESVPRAPGWLGSLKPTWNGALEGTRRIEAPEDVNQRPSNREPMDRRSASMSFERHSCLRMRPLLAGHLADAAGGVSHGRVRGKGRETREVQAGRRGKQGLVGSEAPLLWRHQLVGRRTSAKSSIVADIPQRRAQG